MNYEIFLSTPAAAFLCDYNAAHFYNVILRQKKALPWIQVKEYARRRNSRKAIKASHVDAFLAAQNFKKNARRIKARAIADLNSTLYALRRVEFENKQAAFFEKNGMADFYNAAIIAKFFDLIPQNFYVDIAAGLVDFERRGGRIFVNFDSFVDYYNARRKLHIKKT